MLVVILETKTTVSNNRDWWRARLQRIEAEGLTTKAYADREGLDAQSLYYWRKVFRSETSRQSRASRVTSLAGRGTPVAPGIRRIASPSYGRAAARPYNRADRISIVRASGGSPLQPRYCAGEEQSAGRATTRLRKDAQPMHAHGREAVGGPACRATGPRKPVSTAWLSSTTRRLSRTWPNRAGCYPRTSSRSSRPT